MKTPVGLSPSTPVRPGRPARLAAVMFGIGALLAVAAGPARADDDRAATGGLGPALDVDGGDYDPWASFNERMFSFNHGVLDRFVVKPVAIGWNEACPDPVKRSVGRAIDN